MAIFCVLDFFREPRVAHFRHVFQIRTKATSCVQVWYTCSLQWLRLGEEKKKAEGRKKKKPQDESIMSASDTQGGHNNLN